jgi:hypothetical protein
MIMSAVTGTALSVISQPELYGDSAFTTQLREAVIAAVTVADDGSTGKGRASDADTPSIATAAATLKSKLAHEETPLTAPERALMGQWLTTFPTHQRPRCANRDGTARGARKDRSGVHLGAYSPRDAAE